MASAIEGAEPNFDSTHLFCFHMKLFCRCRGFIVRPTHNGQPPSVRLAAFPRQGKLKGGGKTWPAPFFIFLTDILRFFDFPSSLYWY